MSQAQGIADTDEQIAAVLSAALLQGDNTAFLNAAKAAAWERLISQVAARLGQPRPHVARMLGGDAPVTLEVAMRLMTELKMKVQVEPVMGVQVNNTQATASPVAYVRKF